jgi:ABC-type oligopeptide transport system substrate-binding subunit
MRSREAESLVERSRALRSRDERLALFRQVDRHLVVEQTLAVPTAYISDQLVHRPWVEGLWASPLMIARSAT